MRLRFRRTWRQFKAGQETDEIADGIATTLIRVGAAALVEDVNNDDISVESKGDSSQQADDSDGSDDGAGDAGRSETTVIPVTLGHKQRSRANKPNPGGA